MTLFTLNGFDTNMITKELIFTITVLNTNMNPEGTYVKVVLLPHMAIAENK
jgi:hypothetical protein